MTAIDPIATAEAECIVEIIEERWHTLPDHQRAAWLDGLPGKDFATVDAVMTAIIDQAANQPPSWAGFASLYDRETKPAPGESRTASLSTADRPEASTHIRLCLAWCRRCNKHDWTWRQQLGWEHRWPNHHEFDAAMRGVADHLELADGVPFDQAADWAVNAYAATRRTPPQEHTP